ETEVAFDIAVATRIPDRKINSVRDSTQHMPATVQYVLHAVTQLSQNFLGVGFTHGGNGICPRNAGFQITHLAPEFHAVFSEHVGRDADACSLIQREVALESKIVDG